MAQRVTGRSLCGGLLSSVVILWLLTTDTSGAGTRPQDSQVLGAGDHIEREIRGGESHSFRIRLAASQFLYMAVEQRGVDVAVAIAGPDGRSLLTVDSPNGTQGIEPVVLIAEVSGDYRLEVIVPLKQAATGKYEIRILALREAGAADREHVVASRAFEEARQVLRPQRTAATRRVAIEKYQQALAFFQTSGERYRAALTYGELGITYAELGEFRQAAEHFNQALRLYRELNDRYLEASALNNLGRVFDVLGEPQQALDIYGRALVLAHTQANRASEASILNNIGVIYNSLADWQRGLEYFHQARLLFQTLGDQRREAIALQNIGVAYRFLGDIERALEHYRRALALRKTVNDKAGEAETLSDIGYIYARQGRTQEALMQYQQALLLQRVIGNRLGEGQTFSYLGGAYLAAGEPARAREYFEQSLPLLRAAGDRRFEALATNNLGQALAAQGDSEQARARYTTALATFRELGDRQGEAQTLQGLARIAHAQGQFDEARRQLEAALTLFEDVRTRVSSPQLRASYLATRQDAYQLYVDLLMQQHRREPSAGNDAVALQISERARARGLLEMLTEANADIRQGVDARLIARERELAQQLNAKAERLTQRNIPAQLEALKKEVSQLEIEHEQVQSDIRRASPRYAALTQPQPLKLEEIQQQLLDKNSLLVEYSLGEERSYLWVAGKDSIASYELPKRALIEEAAKRVNDLLVARSLRPRNETPPQRITRIAEADAQLSEAAKRLSEMVLAPAAARLAGNRLLIVADGALQYVPFAMLPIAADKGDIVPLIVQNEIVTLPSASTLAVMRRELNGRQPAPKMLAVFADPVFAGDDERGKMGTIRPGNKPGGKGEVKAQATEVVAIGRNIVHEEEKSSDIASGKLLIPRLPYTRQEAERILAVTPNTANLKAIDFRASRALATGVELGQYRYLHFATHGLLDTENSKLSALVLSRVDEHGKPQDGFLRAHEIYNLNLPAELVVLSACQTGLGKEYKGEGLVGLTRGFMYAGAARVVVSLWNVNDKATADLMAKFYQRMLKDRQRPAEALRSAQVEMWRQKQWQSPYYWAGFVLQGEWK
jgi:CHAT domain-containing protein/tetratricopeptide (TPR) repeat protein